MKIKILTAITNALTILSVMFLYRVHPDLFVAALLYIMSKLMNQVVYVERKIMMSDAFKNIFKDIKKKDEE